MWNNSLAFRIGLNLPQVGLSIFDNFYDNNKGLDIDFKVTKTIDTEPNSSEITIFNLPKELKQYIESYQQIELYTAFDNDDYSLIFIGNIKDNNEITYSKGELDKSLKIVCYDAGDVYNSAYINKSYKGNYEVLNIINECLKVMNIPVGEFIKMPMIVKNYVARGRCIDVIKDLCNRYNLQFNIENGFANITSIYNNNETPKYGLNLNDSNCDAPEKIQNGWKIKTTLIPWLKINTYVFCNFEELKGNFRIVKLIHTGNNYGQKGETEIYVN